MSESDPTPAADQPPAAPPPQSRPGSKWSGGRVAGMIAASFTALVGGLLLLGGLALIGIHSFARDDDGFYTSDNERLLSDSYAITTDRINLGADVANRVPEELLATVRARAQNTGARPLFIGIARAPHVDGYLDGVGHTELTDIHDGDPVFEQFPGRAPRGAPAAEDFWVAQSQGRGEQFVDWDAESGAWTIAVMNADAARGVSVDADIGAKVGWLLWVGVGLALVGLALTATGVILIIVISRRASRDPGLA